MRVHQDIEPMRTVPITFIAVSGVELKLDGQDVDYRIYTTPTCPGMGTPAAVCNGYDIVAETGPGTSLISFEGTVLVMDVLPTGQHP